ncbi:MAG: A24 family peptidase, partial [Patescibacteria group bacterium]|nr:A24 family peptidase [Patescibacteria group bacterium]
ARAFIMPQTLLEGLFAAAIGGGFFWLIVLVSRERWMGLGDAKLGVLTGLLVGFPGVLVALVSAALLGGITGVTLLAVGNKTLGDQIPFAPFLVLGTLIALFGTSALVPFFSFETALFLS